jgi:AraC-like DNA-binding protein
VEAPYYGRVNALHRTHSSEELVADPIGRYYLGETHLVWCASPSLCGSAHWGRPSVADAIELTRLYELARAPALQHFDVFMDDAEVEHVDWKALGVIREYVQSRLPEWGGRIRKQAVQVPSGVVAIILAGLVPLIGPTYPIRFFGSRGAAVDWLGRGDATVVLEEVERLVAEARGTTPTVKTLRSYLEGALVQPTLEKAAAALDRSPRSLQRELREARTSFAVELTRARVGVACALLSEGDESVESIARQVGCLTSSRLSALFRKELGETPTAYRARHLSGAQ